MFLVENDAHAWIHQRAWRRTSWSVWATRFGTWRRVFMHHRSNDRQHAELLWAAAVSPCQQNKIWDGARWQSKSRDRIQAPFQVLHGAWEAWTSEWLWLHWFFGACCKQKWEQTAAGPQSLLPSHLNSQPDTNTRSLSLKRWHQAALWFMCWQNRSTLQEYSDSCVMF